MNTIKFFNESNEDYYFLSNFYKCKIIYDNKIYDSSEHLYQCWKFISFTLDDINNNDDILVNNEVHYTLFSSFAQHL